MKNEYTVDYQTIKNWHKELNVKGVRLVLFIIWCVMTLLCLAFGIVFAFNSAHIYAFFFFWTALFCFYKGFIQPKSVSRFQYKRLVSLYGKENWTRTVSFEDDGIIIEEEKNHSHYNYCDIVKITTKNDLIFLKLKTNLFLILYKSKFVDCTWDDCKQKIIENNPNVKY